MLGRNLRLLHTSPAQARTRRVRLPTAGSGSLGARRRRCLARRRPLEAGARCRVCSERITIARLQPRGERGAVALHDIPIALGQHRSARGPRAVARQRRQLLRERRPVAARTADRGQGSHCGRRPSPISRVKGRAGWPVPGPVNPSRPTPAPPARSVFISRATHGVPGQKCSASGPKRSTKAARDSRWWSGAAAAPARGPSAPDAFSMAANSL